MRKRLRRYLEWVESYNYHKVFIMILHYGIGDDVNERTVKCPICGKPYKVSPFYAGDQSACPDCQMKARRKVQWVVGVV